MEESDNRMWIFLTGRWEFREPTEEETREMLSSGFICVPYLPVIVTPIDISNCKKEG